MKRKINLYPGCDAVEKEKNKAKLFPRDMEDAPDFIGNAPNYDKFRGMDPAAVLVWLNID